MPPIEAPTTACSRSMPRCSVSNRCCAATMSRSAKRGKAHARLRRAVRRRRREAVADRVGDDHAPARRVERLAGADEEIEPMVRRRQRRADEDRVRAIGVQRAVRDERLPVVDDRLARLERAGRRARTRDAARRRGRARAADVFTASSMTVRVPTPLARSAKPSLISSSAIRRVISSSSMTLPSRYCSTSHGKSRFGMRVAVARADDPLLAHQRAPAERDLVVDVDLAEPDDLRRPAAPLRPRAGTPPRGRPPRTRSRRRGRR